MMDKVIRKLADAAKAENWDAVDAQIPTIVKNPIYVQWAYERALSSSNPNLKDLGASILEKAVIKESQFSKMRDKLFYRMMEETNQYVRYRSAFALAAHGPGTHKEEVIRVLQEASHDKDVGIFAKVYLKQLKE
jgi:hypothetical protein